MSFDVVTYLARESSSQAMGTALTVFLLLQWSSHFPQSVTLNYRVAINLNSDKALTMST